MLEPFEGEPTNYGIPVASSDHLREVIGKASRAGIASFVHAIGDAANRVVLDAIEVSRRAGEGTRLRHRIEHAQIVHPADVPRFAALGVIASMQPIHATQDMLAADALWGKRSAHAYAWRSLLDAGAVVAFGSDSPVEDLNVMMGIHAAVTRRRADGSPGPDGWYAEQRLTVGEAVYAYTAGARLRQRRRSDQRQPRAGQAGRLGRALPGYLRDRSGRRSWKPKLSARWWAGSGCTEQDGSGI